MAKSTKNLKIYEAILQHYHYVNVFSEKTRRAAKKALKCAIQIDPDHPLTLAMLADWYRLEYVRMGADKKFLERAEDLAQHALCLDPQGKTGMNYRKSERIFEDYGTVDPEMSYHVELKNVVNTKNQDIKTMVDPGRYFSIFAPRQSGKTTLG